MDKISEELKKLKADLARGHGCPNDHLRQELDMIWGVLQRLGAKDLEGSRDPETRYYVSVNGEPGVVVRVKDGLTVCDFCSAVLMELESFDVGDEVMVSLQSGSHPYNWELHIAFCVSGSFEPIEILTRHE